MCGSGSEQALHCNALQSIACIAGIAGIAMHCNAMQALGALGLHRYRAGE